MAVVLIANGETSQKTIGRSRVGVTPHVIGEPSSAACQFGSLGVGYYRADNSRGKYWGMSLPHNLINSWRAMKLLERTTSIDEDRPLALCYQAVTADRLKDGDADELSTYFESYQKFVNARQAAAVAIPSPEDLDAMLRVAMNADIQISMNPILEYVEIGVLPRLPIFDAIIQKQALQQGARPSVPS
jgi:hypothetical protein